MSLTSVSPSQLADTGPQTPQQERRAHILAAARCCFARAGFHGASMQQICAEARMSPGALYRYFPSKEAIIEAIAQEERVQAGHCLAGLAGEGDVVDRITAVGMDYLRQTLDPDSGGLMVEICSESIRNTAIGKRFHEIERDVRSAFVGTLRQAQEQGEIDGTIDLDIAVTVLLAVGDGLVMRLQLENDFDIDTIEPYLRRVVSGLFDPVAADR